jgi:hypothetical protein
VYAHGKRCRKQCLSLFNPRGHPCNPDCTRVTDEQLQADFGEPRSLLQGRLQTAWVQHADAFASGAAAGTRLSRYHCVGAACAAFRPPNAPFAPRGLAPPAGVKDITAQISAAFNSERCGGQCLSTSNPTGCLCDKRCQCMGPTTFAGVVLSEPGGRKGALPSAALRMHASPLPEGVARVRRPRCPEPDPRPSSPTPFIQRLRPQTSPAAPTS